jgi:hypothetical protein
MSESLTKSIGRAQEASGTDRIERGRDSGQPFPALGDPTCRVAHTLKSTERVREEQGGPHRLALHSHHLA